MEVLALGPHAPHVKAEHALNWGESLGDGLWSVVGGDRDGDVERHFEVRWGTGQLVGVHLGSVGRVVQR